MPESHLHLIMHPKFLSLKLVLTSMAGAAFLTGCDKQEPVTPAPALGTAPAPAMVPAESGAAPAATATVLTGDAAIAAFKTEIDGIKAFMEANEGATDPAVGLDNLRELIRRAAAVSTAGLPEDLASAYQNMTTVMAAVQATIDDLPVPMEQIQKYMEEEKTKGGAAEQEAEAKLAAFKTAMAGHEKDGEAASAKVKEAGAKYGIEFVDLTGK